MAFPDNTLPGGKYLPNELLNNSRIQGMSAVSSANEVMAEFPSNDGAASLVHHTRRTVSNIFHGKDDRLLVICGPCSIHDPKAAREYAAKLKEVAARVSDDILVVMRVYFEKPRTTVGWKGLINDPDLDESYHINKGIRLARSLLLDIASMGMPAGTEFLDVISPQYVMDLVSWGAIGARTAESQIHRELSSGLSCPIGIKNGTEGSLKPAVDGILAANHSHVFLSATKEGTVAIFKTAGNDDCHIILRGGKAPNYAAEHVADTLAALTAAGCNKSIMIDASHGNTLVDGKKNFKRQIQVCDDIAGQVGAGNKFIRGVMIESNLVEGNQKIAIPLTYGQSVTDGCLSWPDTVGCLEALAAGVRKRRKA